jgi:hypothetical protein
MGSASVAMSREPAARRREERSNEKSEAMAVDLVEEKSP